MIRAALLALALLLAGCAEDTPTITQQPEVSPTAAESPAVSESEDINISAVDYEFDGVPDAVSAGPHRFILENGGEEPHNFYLFFITGDQSVEELAELSEKKVNQLTQAVDIAEAGPGKSAQFDAELVPGRFGYICVAETKEGEPHFDLGMFGEFTVA